MSVFRYASIVQCDRCGARAPGIPDMVLFSITPPGWVQSRPNAEFQLRIRLKDGEELSDFCGKCLALPVTEFLSNWPAV